MPVIVMKNESVDVERSTAAAPSLAEDGRLSYWTARRSNVSNINIKNKNTGHS
jgi:hypothetical protein